MKSLQPCRPWAGPGARHHARNTRAGTAGPSVARAGCRVCRGSACSVRCWGRRDLPSSSRTMLGAAERIGPVAAPGEGLGWPGQMAVAGERVNCLVRQQLAAASLPAVWCAGTRLLEVAGVGAPRGHSPGAGVAAGCCAHPGGLRMGPSRGQLPRVARPVQSLHPVLISTPGLCTASLPPEGIPAASPQPSCCPSGLDTSHKPHEPTETLLPLSLPCSMDEIPSSADPGWG